MVRRQSQQPSARPAQPVMGGCGAGGQRGGGQQRTLGRTGGSRCRHHQGDVVVDRFTHPQRRQCGSAIAIGRQRQQRRRTAVQNLLKGGQQRARRGALRHGECAQDGYPVSSPSRASSNGQPLAARRARTRSMSSGDGSWSVIWVINTPMSMSSNPSAVHQFAGHRLDLIAGQPTRQQGEHRKVIGGWDALRIPCAQPGDDRGQESVHTPQLPPSSLGYA